MIKYLATTIIVFWISGCGKNIPLLGEKEKIEIKQKSFAQKREELRNAYTKKMQALKEQKLKAEYKGFEYLLKEKNNLRKDYLKTVNGIEVQYESHVFGRDEYKIKMKKEKFEYLDKLRIIDRKVANKKKERDEK